MIPSPTVCATAVVTKRLRRFSDRGDERPRSRGVSALVETDVATAFAVSWKPFVKSKTSARRR